MIICPCCSQWHEIKRLADHNWFGQLAERGECFAFAWCPDAGREVGDWVPETPRLLGRFIDSPNAEQKQND